MFIRNRNEKLFCDVIKGELMYFWRHSYRNSPKTLTLHSYTPWKGSFIVWLILRKEMVFTHSARTLVRMRDFKKVSMFKFFLLYFRALNKDFSGELLHQCYDLIKNRPIQPSDQTISRLSSLNNNNITKPNIEKLQKQSELSVSISLLQTYVLCE